jgi:hypothetical protein
MSWTFVISTGQLSHDGAAVDDPKLGPIAMRLIKDPANEMFGRDGFSFMRIRRLTPVKRRRDVSCRYMGPPARAAGVFR